MINHFFSQNISSTNCLRGKWEHTAPRTIFNANEKWDIFAFSLLPQKLHQSLVNLGITPVLVFLLIFLSSRFCINFFPFFFWRTHFKAELGQFARTAFFLTRVFSLSNFSQEGEERETLHLHFWRMEKSKKLFFCLR